MAYKESEWRDIVEDCKDMKEYSFSSEDWQNHLGGLSEGDLGIIHGLPGGGKTYYCLQLCKELQKNHGGVLFIQHEETKDIIERGAVVGYKFRSSFSRKVKKVKPEGVKILPDFARNSEGNIDGKYLKKFKFILIDSATVYGMDYKKMKSFAATFPKTVFIFIYQSVKGGSHRGSQADTHGVDFVIKVINGTATVEKTRLEGIAAYDIFSDFPNNNNDKQNESENSRSATGGKPKQKNNSN